mmetsp:Transcript_18459/g.39661  ORF Transcript_18459/g.39661 Transcript_18459/m.39661 type:complete len:211 (+) Transcript_18459:353-985(+)
MCSTSSWSRPSACRARCCHLPTISFIPASSRLSRVRSFLRGVQAAVAASRTTAKGIPDSCCCCAFPGAAGGCAPSMVGSASSTRGCRMSRRSRLSSIPMSLLARMSAHRLPQIEPSTEVQTCTACSGGSTSTAARPRRPSEWRSCLTVLRYVMPACALPPGPRWRRLPRPESSSCMAACCCSSCCCITRRAVSLSSSASCRKPLGTCSAL